MVKLLALLGISTLVSLVYASTTFHVNKGCILLDGVPICSGYTRKVSSTVEVYARYDGNNKNDQSIPGCHTNFNLYEWKDIYYGADNCLYTVGGGSTGQCCNQQSGLGYTINPYTGT